MTKRKSTEKWLCLFIFPKHYIHVSYGSYQDALNEELYESFEPLDEGQSIEILYDTILKTFNKKREETTVIWAPPNFPND